MSNYNGFDFFDNNENNNNNNYNNNFNYEISETVNKAVEQKVKAMKRNYTTITIIVSVCLLFVFILAAFLIYRITSDNMARVYNERMDNFYNEYAEKISEKLDYQYEISDGKITVSSIVANKTLDSIVEIYCYKSSAGTSNTNYTSTATAFIINDEGYLLTNTHVVTYEQTSGIWGGSTKLCAYSKLLCNFRNSESSYELEIVAYDEAMDLAILKFKRLPKNFKYVTFANSDNLTIGENAVAIGNAEGLGISVTTGTVSNTVRKYDKEEYLQTDAAINPGNSGGPLFNSTAYCIGVITSKIADTANEGLGFAISSNEVMRFLDNYNKTAKEKVNYSQFKV
ncbi:MAG: S1C family serine protease [Clostridia bacterium]